MLTAAKAYAMLGNETLWETATACHRILAEAAIPHSVCGGEAVCLHGYQRNTVDLDLIIDRNRADAARASVAVSGVAVQFLMAGDRAGNDSPVRLPEPEGELNVEVIEGLPVLRLSKLIEIKLACGSGNIRRTHKDFADVVELIAIRQLDSSFARHLHKSVRKTYKELVKHAGAS